MVAFLALLQALPAFIQSLPYLFQLMLKLMGVIDSFVAWSKQNNLNAWIDDLEKTIDDLNKADTPEKKRGAARGMVDIIRKLS